MKMITSVSQRTSGELTILGKEPNDQGPEIRAHLGVVPQKDMLDRELKVWENLVTYGRYFGLPRKWLKTKVEAENATGRPMMPAFRVDRASRIVKAVNQAYKTVRGVEQPTGAMTPPGYYGTDAGHFYKELGMEGVVCGPGGRYNTMPDERVDIVDYLDMIRVYLLTILDICEVA
jgi:acetylornithine deacetylase/succinyl-diaminopimelate desuccinylase-like protein